MEEEVRKSSELLSGRQQQLKETDLELTRAKEIINEKNREIIKLKAYIESSKESVTKYSEERTTMERDLNMAIEGKKSIQIELDRVISINERLTQANKEFAERERKISFESSSYTKRVEEMTIQINMLRQQLEGKQREIESLIESKRSVQVDYQKWEVNISNIKEENSRLLQTVRSFEMERDSFKMKINEFQQIMMSKEEELKVSIRNLRVAEEKIVSLQSSTISYDFENLKRNLQIREEEIISLRKAKDEEYSRRMQIETEFKRSEREWSSSSIEIKMAKEELEKVLIIKEKIIEERTQLISEFEALKEHVKVLETQNMSVRLSIINYLATY